MHTAQLTASIIVEGIERTEMIEVHYEEWASDTPDGESHIHILGIDPPYFSGDSDAMQDCASVAIRRKLREISRVRHTREDRGLHSDAEQV